MRQSHDGFFRVCRLQVDMRFKPDTFPCTFRISFRKLFLTIPQKRACDLFACPREGGRHVAQSRLAEGAIRHPTEGAGYLQAPCYDEFSLTAHVKTRMDGK